MMSCPLSWRTVCCGRFCENPKYINKKNYIFEIIATFIKYEKENKNQSDNWIFFVIAWNTFFEENEEKNAVMLIAENHFSVNELFRFKREVAFA